MNEIVPTIKEDQKSQLVDEMKIKTSPIKLSEGGAPKLKIANMNHHRVNRGTILSIPRMRISLRVFIRE
jgi:hypothetical protein